MLFKETGVYKTALVTRHAAFSVAAMQKKINAIGVAGEAHGLKPGDGVLVYLPNGPQLFSTLWALMNKQVTTVVVEPTDRPLDLAGMARDSGAELIITSQAYAAQIGFPRVIVWEDLASIAGDRTQIVEIQPKDLRFMFYSSENNYESPVQMLAEDITAFWEQLAAVVPSDTRCMMLSTNLPFQKILLESLWASSRGITVVLEGLDEQVSWDRYTAHPDAFQMKFGIFYFGSFIDSSEKDKYSLLFDTAKFADENGFCALWTPERHFNAFGGLYPNPSVLNSALAMTTSRIQLRSGSLVSPLHHPVRIAEDWALVDNLSRGRVGISFASGWQCDDFVFFPENYADRHQYMMNQVDIVQRLWRGEAVPFKNGLGKETSVKIFPKPVQQELPVWVTVSGKLETFVDAGKIGANILTHLLWQDTDELIEKIAAYRASLQENGFDPKSRIVSVMVHTYLGESNEAVKEKVRAPLKNYIRSSTQLIQSMAKSTVEAANSKEVGGRYGSVGNEMPEHLMDELAEIAFNRFFEQAGLLGTVEKAKTMLKRLKGYDVDEVASLIDFGLAKDEVMEGLTYLDTLRRQYDGDNAWNFPVTVTHVTPEEMSCRHLRTQRLVLTESKDVDDLECARPATAAVQHVMEDGKMKMTVTACDTAMTLQPLFSAAISEEF